MSDFNYGFETTIQGTAFDQVVESVTEALKGEGFGVLTKIDVKETLKKKLDAEFRPYVILGACNPVLAKQALEYDPNIGLLLPCNVVVQQSGADDVTVSIAAPKEMFTLVGDNKLDPVVSEADAKLRRVLQAVQP